MSTPQCDQYVARPHQPLMTKSVRALHILCSGTRVSIHPFMRVAYVQCKWTSLWIIYPPSRLRSTNQLNSTFIVQLKSLGNFNLTFMHSYFEAVRTAAGPFDANTITRYEPTESHVIPVYIFYHWRYQTVVNVLVLKISRHISDSSISVVGRQQWEMWNNDYLNWMCEYEDVWKKYVHFIDIRTCVALASSGHNKSFKNVMRWSGRAVSHSNEHFI